MEEKSIEEMVKELDNTELAWALHQVSREIEGRLLEADAPDPDVDPEHPPAGKPKGGGHSMSSYCPWRNDGGLNGRPKVVQRWK